ncbi:MAG TPA: YifB family Mg chelatase-like AAA ATPase [Candidatus Polarisedimenticolaceae bacterium]
MLGRATGAVLAGIEARLVAVEVDLAGGLPTIAAVGLPDSAVREGLDRVRAALRHAGFRLPQHRITLNLAPAELPKRGTGLDLPIAAALLTADGQVPVGPVRAVLAGELALDGALRPVRGALSIALAATDARFARLVVPEENAAEAALVEGLEVYGAASLAEALALVAGRPTRRPTRVEPHRRLEDARQRTGVADLAEVKGQASARRALEIAAAGGHHLLLTGPPGSGKTMLARRLPGILPPMTLDEALRVTQVWSAAGLADGLVVERPFRAPHHGISFAGLTGGGLRLKPGEITLASGGVLYLDELTEFRRDALEALRQPLEEGAITIARLHERATFPAEFALIASMNPCPCGHLGDPRGRCRCSPIEVDRYLAKISGPLIDRFDLVVDVPAVDPLDLAAAKAGEGSLPVRQRVLAARAAQEARGSVNSRLTGAELDRAAPLEAEGSRLLSEASKRLGLSARGWTRVRRVARTIADLEGGETVEPRHLAEAVGYREGRSGAMRAPR